MSADAGLLVLLPLRRYKAKRQSSLYSGEVGHFEPRFHREVVVPEEYFFWFLQN